MPSPLLAAIMVPLVGLAVAEAGQAQSAADAEHHTFATTDDWTLHYATMGDSGSPVFLIHGSGGAAATWLENGVAHRLAENHRVIVPDMRGHGRSENPREGDMPLDVIELMDYLDIERAHVHGFSMGGSIVAQLMARVPDRLITASFGGSGVRETEEWADRVPADAEGTSPVAAEASRIYRERLESREETQPTEAESRRLAAMEAGTWTEPARPGPERRDLDLKTIEFPVLAIVGEYDGFYSRTHRLWREVPKFQSIMLPQRGHLDSYYPRVIHDWYLNGLQTFIDSHDEG
ncbi:MAG: alpha/beta hydrolase [Gemmatimonadota bacterium]